MTHKEKNVFQTSGIKKCKKDEHPFYTVTFEMIYNLNTNF